jgi:hypothetical protein
VSGIGPILLFDKSTLQSLSVDESVWFDTHYYPCITPLFFVETLADLEKEVDEGRTPEDVVGNLAEKTPTGGHPNIYHQTLCINELLGHAEIEMDHRIIVSEGRRVASGSRRGFVMDEPQEVVALRRWEEGKFLEVERTLARDWRKALSGLDLGVVYQQGRDVIASLGRPRNLAEAKAMAVKLLDKPASRWARDALLRFNVPDPTRRAILQRWSDRGSPPLKEVAPYTAFVVTVDTFFAIALGTDLISRERPSNKVDIAYLYYLPFCMAFTSNDRLHERTAPVFLDDKQVFIRGQDLKADLARLDAYYDAFPDAVKLRGTMSFATWPPTDGDFLTASLWDKLMRPDWRDLAKKPPMTMSPETKKKLLEQMREMKNAPAGGPTDFDSDDANAVLISRRVRASRGKWRRLPPEVEKRAREEGEE